MNKQISITIVMVAVVIGGAFYLSSPNKNKEEGASLVGNAYAAKFATLSQNGNSSCSGTFSDSIASMPDENRLQGSCCSPMSLHRYTEQVEGLEEFSAKGGSASGGKSISGQNISKIPNDPYDIEAGLAKELLSYYDLELTTEEQKAYDYAMLNSNEKGPCCCKCWRWYVYGGLGKYLIKSHGFTGEQVTEVWNLSDGCGGEDEAAGISLALGQSAV